MVLSGSYGVADWFSGLLITIVKMLLRLCYLLNQKSIRIQVSFYSQVEISSREDYQVNVMFTFLRVECDVVASDMHVVCEFLMCFPRTFTTYLRSENLRSP